ncbi:MAG TPA: FkbM family methyltransferase [Bryobacteraceae bacterium]|jgi:FkbM family methyltransferase|nr:FkbM family methyltransferase [Bryobacteraceae bacterium]
MASAQQRVFQGLRHLERLPEVWRCSRETADWPKLFSAYIGLKRTLPFTIALRSGSFEFDEASDIPTFWQVFFRNVYPVYPDDRIIVDAGANIGSFSLYALENAPSCRLISIEPAPDTFARLRGLIEAHHLESRCTLYQAALGDRDGETCIRLAPGSQFRRTGADGHPVPMYRLESLLPADTEIDFLKLDIEGGEYTVLRSTPPQVLRRFRRIVMEYHPAEPARNAIEPLLSAGFRILRQQDDGNGYGLVSFERK